MARKTVGRSDLRRVFADERARARPLRAPEKKGRHQRYRWHASEVEVHPSGQSPPAVGVRRAGGAWPRPTGATSLWVEWRWRGIPMTGNRGSQRGTRSGAGRDGRPTRGSSTAARPRDPAAEEVSPAAAGHRAGDWASEVGWPSGAERAPGEGRRSEEGTAVRCRSPPAADPPSAAVFWSLDSGPGWPPWRRFEGSRVPGSGGAMENAGLRVGRVLPRALSAS